MLTSKRAVLSRARAQPLSRKFLTLQVALLRISQSESEMFIFQILICSSENSATTRGKFITNQKRVNLFHVFWLAILNLNLTEYLLHEWMLRKHSLYLLWSDVFALNDK